MADDDQPADASDLDEYGLKIQTYISTVLVVVPPSDYAETTLRYARSALYNVKVGTRSVSTATEDLIKGVFQDEFQVDGPIAGERMENYSGVIFVGGRGATQLEENSECLRLAREAAEAGKLIAAWDYAIGVLAKAGVVRGRRVTSIERLRGELKAAGAKFTGRQIEIDKNLVTAIDDSAGFRFGKALAQIVAIEE